MKQEMRISIVTVVYNNAMGLEKTARSVLAQDYDNLEFIVVDGGSTDETPELLKQYGDRITKWRSEPDNGLFDAMNKGVNMASGDYVCFMNGGDVFCNQTIVSQIVERLQQTDLPDVIYGNILVEKDGALIERAAKEPHNSHKMYFCHQSAFTRRSLLLRFPFDAAHRYSADVKFFKQCRAANARFLNSHLPVCIYDTKGQSNTNRIIGLLDNIAIIKETDRGWEKLKFLARLHFVILWRKLTGKN